MEKFEIYRKVFGRMDEDADGKISASELCRCMGALGTREGISLSEAEAAVEGMDADGDGLVGFEDFVRFVEETAEEDVRDSELREAFRMYVQMEEESLQQACDECITPRSLKRMLSRLGYGGKSVEECEAMISCFDLDGDGVISFAEFRIMMQ